MWPKSSRKEWAFYALRFTAEQRGTQTDLSESILVESETREYILIGLATCIELFTTCYRDSIQFALRLMIDFCGGLSIYIHKLVLFIVKLETSKVINLDCKDVDLFVSNYSLLETCWYG